MKIWRNLSIWLPTVTLAAVTLLLCSCGNDGKQRPAEVEINAVCGVKFGEIHDPRNGEGKLLDITDHRPDIEYFSKISVEVTPFEHKVWRIVLIAPEISGGDPLTMAAEAVGKRFKIKFTPANGEAHAELRQQKVVLRRRLDWGPRACEAEFICKTGAAQAEKTKKSPRFINAEKKENAFNDVVILREMTAEFHQKNGRYPQQLTELQSIAGSVPVPLIDPWGKPYQLEIKHNGPSIKASHPVE